jgi:hypothetical protein
MTPCDTVNNGMLRIYYTFQREKRALNIYRNNYNMYTEWKIIKVKVKLSLCLTKHHAMKMDWGSGSISPCILDLGTR